MASPSSAIRCTPPLTSPGPTTNKRRRSARRLFGKERCPTCGLEQVPRLSFTAACKAAGRRLDLGVGEACSRGFVEAFLGVGGTRNRLLPPGRLSARPPATTTAAAPFARSAARAAINATPTSGDLAEAWCRSVVNLASSPARSPIRRPRSASSRNTDAIRPSSRSIAVPRILFDASRKPSILLLSKKGEGRAAKGQSTALDSVAGGVPSSVQRRRTILSGVVLVGLGDLRRFLVAFVKEDAVPQL